MPSCSVALPSCHELNLTVSCVLTTQNIVSDTSTRLEQYIRSTGMPPAALARQARISRQHLLRLRRGLAEPTRDVMVRLALAASALRARRVFVADLFELTETEDLIQGILVSVVDLLHRVDGISCPMNAGQLESARDVFRSFRGTKS